MKSVIVIVKEQIIQKDNGTSLYKEVGYYNKTLL